MNLFNLFGNRPNFAEGIAQANSTKGALLLDVRTPQEYGAGHIPGSVNLPLDRIETIKADKAQPLFVYCLSGARSSQATAYLARQGYTVTNNGGNYGYRGILE